MSSNEVAQQDYTNTSMDRGLQHGASAYTKQQREQLRALANLDEASDADIQMLEAVAQRTGLDPFVKQIYLVGRRTKTGGYRGEPERWETKWTVQTGIDGFRQVTFRYADSRNESHSISAPKFFDREGNARPFWLREWGYPVAVETEVRVGDSVGVGIATWDEYVQTTKQGKPNSMWEKMGATMLSKCSEAQAHRRVCALTAGMYVEEEMLQSDNGAEQAHSGSMDASYEVAEALNRTPREVEQAGHAVDVAVESVPSVEQLEYVAGMAQDLNSLKAFWSANSRLFAQGTPEYERLKAAKDARKAQLGG